MPDCPSPVMYSKAYQVQTAHQLMYLKDKQLAPNVLRMIVDYGVQRARLRSINKVLDKNK